MHTTTVIEISDYIKKHADTPFKWGVFDCCVFVSHVIELQTGLQLHKPYSGKYNDEQSSIEIQDDIGTVESLMDSHFARVEPDQASRGDIHMLEDGVMALQFSGYRWATTKDGVKPSQVESKICWRVA